MYEIIENMIYSDTGFIGEISAETEKEYYVKWFYNPRNGNGSSRTFLKEELIFNS